MQTDVATGLHSPVADGGSLHSALVSLGYSDFLDRHIQNHAMAAFPLPPPPFGDDTIALGRGPLSCNRAGNELWSTPNAGLDSMFEGIPFDANATTQWDFNRGVVSSPGYEWALASRGGSEMSSPGVSGYSSSSLSMHRRHVVVGGSDNTSCSSNDAPLNGSGFLRAVQGILAEFAGYALEGCDRTSFSDRRFNNNNNNNSSYISFAKEVEIENKKKHLMSLLQVVDDQYNRCLDEIHTVVSAFHAVTELDPNLHARFALPAISAMYRDLRERISSHILAMGAASPRPVEEEETSSFESSFIQKQWALQQLKKRDHQLWRPQRGLPERSVSVLRSWMFQNFLHPYPKDAEKHLLALKSGLTRSQVSNWFINARVRLWKPMIEEMYAEMNRRNAPRSQEEGNGSHQNLLRFESRRFVVD